MLIPESKIEEILERTDLVALISRHVELKKSGRSYKGRCPFHQEKSASFYVTPEMRRYKCFGCQAGGDAIAFVQRYLGKTFVDAVKDLAREAGVDLEAAVDPSVKEREQLKQATDFAAEHFRSRLWDAEVGRKAREYLASRGVSEEVARAFGLGWAPAAWSLLADRLTEAGLLSFAEKAGLVARRTKGEGYYDTFRGRLIIPIRSPEGRTIAFGGRLLESMPGQTQGDGPKYLNSRESKLYNKSETLYGMDVSREEMRRRKQAVLVEGYFDCIGMHVGGVKNAVALCSTALTPGHLSLLSRHDAKELVLLLDGDEAGRKAVERLSGALLAAGVTSKVALLPEGEDPDTFARKAGAEGVRALLEAAAPLTEHLFRSVLPDRESSTFEAKMQAVERLRPIAAQVPVGLVRSALFSAMAKHFGLPAAELEAALRGKHATPKPVPKPSAAPASGPAPQPGPAAAPVRPPEALEAFFAACLLAEPGLLPRDTYRTADELVHSGLRAAIAAVAHGRTAEDALFEAAEPVKRALAQAATQVPPAGPARDQAFLEACQKLTLRRIDDQLTQIAKETSRLSGANELTEETRELLARRGELLALKRKMMEISRGST